MIHTTIMSRDDRRRRPLCADNKFSHFGEALKDALSEPNLRASEPPTQHDGTGSGTPGYENRQPSAPAPLYRCLHCGHLPHYDPNKDCGSIDAAGDECDCSTYAPDYDRPVSPLKRVLIVGDAGARTFAALARSAAGYTGDGPSIEVFARDTNAHIQMAQAEEDRLRIQSDRTLVGQVHDEVLMETEKLSYAASVTTGTLRGLVDLGDTEIEQ